MRRLVALAVLLVGLGACVDGDEPMVRGETVQRGEVRGESLETIVHMATNTATESYLNMQE
ncbi:MAG: hypothetical protein ACRD0C_12655 [Acidimicrobiia bacterium]